MHRIPVLVCEANDLNLSFCFIYQFVAHLAISKIYSANSKFVWRLSPEGLLCTVKFTGSLCFLTGFAPKIAPPDC
jgi:hypothetical protein